MTLGAFKLKIKSKDSFEYCYTVFNIEGGHSSNIRPKYIIQKVVTLLWTCVSSTLVMCHLTQLWNRLDTVVAGVVGPIYFFLLSILTLDGVELVSGYKCIERSNTMSLLQ